MTRLLRGRVPACRGRVGRTNFRSGNNRGQSKGPPGQCPDGPEYGEGCLRRSSSRIGSGGDRVPAQVGPVAVVGRTARAAHRQRVPAAQ